MLLATPVPVPDPSWTDVGSFIVSIVGTVATTAVAVVAVVISVQASRRDNRRQARAARERWVTDFNAWLDAGRVHMVMAGESVPLDRDWVAIGDRLNATARTMSQKGALELMLASRDARTHMATVPASKRFRVGSLINSLIKEWAILWVDDPNGDEVKPDVVKEWIDAWAALDDEDDGPEPDPVPAP